MCHRSVIFSRISEKSPKKIVILRGNSLVVQEGENSPALWVLVPISAACATPTITQVISSSFVQSLCSFGISAIFSCLVV